MLKRIADRAAARFAGTHDCPIQQTRAMLVVPMAVVAASLIGHGLVSASPVEIVLGALCLVAAISERNALKDPS